MFKLLSPRPDKGQAVSSGYNGPNNSPRSAQTRALEAAEDHKVALSGIAITRGRQNPDPFPSAFGRGLKPEECNKAEIWRDGKCYSTSPDPTLLTKVEQVLGTQ